MTATIEKPRTIEAHCHRWTDEEIEDLRHGIAGDIAMMASVAHADARKVMADVLQLAVIAMGYRNRAERAEKIIEAWGR